MATDPERERDPDWVYVKIFLAAIAAVWGGLWVMGLTL